MPNKKSPLGNKTILPQKTIEVNPLFVYSVCGQKPSAGAVNMATYPNHVTIAMCPNNITGNAFLNG